MVPSLKSKLVLPKNCTLSSLDEGGLLGLTEYAVNSFGVGRKKIATKRANIDKIPIIKIAFFIYKTITKYILLLNN